jgi:hypothetical protein
MVDFLVFDPPTSWNYLNPFGEFKIHIFKHLFDEIKIRMGDSAGMLIENINAICGKDALKSYG